MLFFNLHEDKVKIPAGYHGKDSCKYDISMTLLAGFVTFYLTP